MLAEGDIHKFSGLSLRSSCLLYRLAVLTNMLRRRPIAPPHSNRRDMVALNVLQPVFPMVERLGRDPVAVVILLEELAFLPPTGVSLVGDVLRARAMDTTNVFSQGIEVV